MRSTVHACSCAPSDQFRYGKCLFFRSKPQTARRQLTASKRSLTTYSQFNLFNDAISKTAFKPKEQKQIGPLKVSPMGLGTWAWGNQLLWGYDKSMDPELQQLFNLVVSKGINIFDTADSYGMSPAEPYLEAWVTLPLLMHAHAICLSHSNEYLRLHNCASRSEILQTLQAACISS